MSPLLAVVKKVPHKEEFWKQQEAAQISGQHYSYHYSYIRQHRDESGHTALKDVDPKQDHFLDFV